MSAPTTINAWGRFPQRHRLVVYLTLCLQSEFSLPISYLVINL